MSTTSLKIDFHLCTRSFLQCPWYTNRYYAFQLYCNAITCRVHSLFACLSLAQASFQDPILLLLTSTTNLLCTPTNFDLHVVLHKGKKSFFYLSLSNSVFYDCLSSSFTAFSPSLSTIIIPKSFDEAILVLEQG